MYVIVLNHIYLYLIHRNQEVEKNTGKLINVYISIPHKILNDLRAFLCVTKQQYMMYVCFLSI